MTWLWVVLALVIGAVVGAVATLVYVGKGLLR